LKRLTSPQVSVGKESSGNVRQRRIVFLDLLRVFAVLLVVFSHYTDSPRFLGIRDFYWVSIGGIGVTLAIVLSGMSLEYNHGGQRHRYAEFIGNRLKRIYPTYWLSLAAGIILGVTMLPSDPFGFSMTVTAFEVFEAKPWVDLARLGVNWFVGLIVALYFLYPFLSRAVRAHPKSTILLALLVSVVSRVLVGRYWAVERPTDWFPPCRLFEFALGIWLVNNRKVFGFLTNLRLGWGETIVAYFGSLSYPVYLVHLTVLGFISLHGAAIGSPQLFLLAFLVGTFVLSNIVFYVESIARKKLRKLSLSAHARKDLS
jgi:peptidoglycan/LPS O-acetylase OafA/YrhL